MYQILQVSAQPNISIEISFYDTLIQFNFYFRIQAINNGDLASVVMYIMALIFVVFGPCLFCYFASSATDRISSIQRTVYELNWYDYSIDLQECFILIMAQPQQPVYFEGLGMVRCTLDCFGKVKYKMKTIHPLFSHPLYKFSFHLLQLIRSAFSYYMAFDAISNRA